MATGVVSWSQTATSNGSADSAVNFAEGMAPSAVNDSARALMASVAKYRDDQAGSVTTGGTTTAYTATSNQGFASLAAMSGQSIRVRFNATNGASPQLNVDGLGLKPIQSVSGTAIGTGVLLANSVWDLTYDNSIPAFLVEGASQVQTGAIADNAVTYAKIQTVTNNKVLGNVSGSTAAPSEIGFGTGIVITGGNITAPSTPVPAAFKNLSIKVATNTTVAVAADFVTVTDGTSFQTLAFSTTINMGTTGAAALDTGTIATSTWYAIWAIAKADGTTSCIASTSSSAPTMPTGYTFKARIGWVRTASGVAQLFGTWQFGRRAQYVVGLAQTSVSLPQAATGTSVALWTAASLTSIVPTATASRVSGAIFIGNGTGVYGAVAPNSSYSTNLLSSTNPPPVIVNVNNGGGSAGMATPFDLMLESSNLYWGVTASAGALMISGWEDNI